MWWFRLKIGTSLSKPHRSCSHFFEVGYSVVLRYSENLSATCAPDLPDLDVNSQAMAEQLEEEETMAPEPEKEEEAATSIIPCSKQHLVNLVTLQWQKLAIIRRSHTCSMVWHVSSDCEGDRYERSCARGPQAGPPG